MGGGGVKGVLASAIQLDDLRPFFGRSAEEASKELGVGLTVLKRRCRELGVSRWPYRQIKCVEKLIEYIRVGNEDKSDLHVKLEQLRMYKESILSGRPMQLPLWAKRSQQHLSKLNYRARVKKGMCEEEIEGSLEFKDECPTEDATSSRTPHRTKRHKRIKSDTTEEEDHSTESKTTPDLSQGSCRELGRVHDLVLDVGMDAFMDESLRELELGQWMPLELAMTDYMPETHHSFAKLSLSDPLSASRSPLNLDGLLPESSFLQGVFLEGMQAQDHIPLTRDNHHHSFQDIDPDRKRFRDDFDLPTLPFTHPTPLISTNAFPFPPFHLWSVR